MNWQITYLCIYLSMFCIKIDHYVRIQFKVHFYINYLWTHHIHDISSMYQKSVSTIMMETYLWCLWIPYWFQKCFQANIFSEIIILNAIKSIIFYLLTVSRVIKVYKRTASNNHTLLRFHWKTEQWEGILFYSFVLNINFYQSAFFIF